MKRPPQSVIGVSVLSLLVIGSTFGCILPAYSGYLTPQVCSLEELEASILALELHEKDLQHVSAVLAQ